MAAIVAAIHGHPRKAALGLVGRVAFVSGDLDCLRGTHRELSEIAVVPRWRFDSRARLARASPDRVALDAEPGASFGDYEEDMKHRLATDSVIPHRLKYKKVSR